MLRYYNSRIMFIGWNVYDLPFVIKINNQLEKGFLKTAGNHRAYVNNLMTICSTFARIVLGMIRNQRSNRVKAERVVGCAIFRTKENVRHHCGAVHMFMFLVLCDV